jgi:hypothetical protein
MVGKIQSSQVRNTAAAQQKAPSKPAKETASASQTAAAGWGAGAAKTTSLKITAAKIDEGPATTPKLQLPKGYKAEVTELSEKLTDKVKGKTVAIEQTDIKVTLTGPNGKKLTLSDGAESIKQMGSEWKETIAAEKKEPSEWAQLDWDASHTMSGAGTAGKMVSVSDAYGSYMGGAHPNHGTALSTFDASTGKQVKLDQLLTQQQMNSLVKDITAKLPKLSNGDGIEGTSFGSDAAGVRDTINSNFALTTDKNGKVKIEIAWESGIHALGGQMAHFTVDAPNDPAFRKAIGME